MVPLSFPDVPVASSITTTEPYDHGKDTEEFYNATKDFKEGMNKDQTVINNYGVKMINKVYCNILYSLQIQLTVLL